MEPSKELVDKFLSEFDVYEDISEFVNKDIYKDIVSVSVDGDALYKKMEDIFRDGFTCGYMNAKGYEWDYMVGWKLSESEKER